MAFVLSVVCVFDEYESVEQLEECVGFGLGCETIFSNPVF